MTIPSGREVSWKSWGAVGEAGDGGGGEGEEGAGVGAEPSDTYLLVSTVSKPTCKAVEWKSKGERKFLFL